ncbi:MAG TPA: PA0069 family radical SAM protein [Myxococcota bacterium]|nr:PA0069 family radical SAM protein [Myxococcota bacterium]
MLRPTSNPPNRFDARSLEWFEPPDPARLQLFEDDSKQILAHNESPDLWHRWSLNPYRGCMHACAYCYARPTHEYLGWGAGTDHDTKILVKSRAPLLLERAFDAPSWKGETVLFSGNTDCYQPVEYRYGLTRACLEVCLQYKNPVAIITKSALIERDVDVLAELARHSRLRVIFSIPFLDPELARAIEPGTPTPARRLRAMAALHDAGVPVAVNIAPLIPGLNDREIPAILKACREAGADQAMMMLLRLPGAVEKIFPERLREALPTRAAGVLARLERARPGGVQENRPGIRFQGHGEEWESTRRLFHLWERKLGYKTVKREEEASPFRRPVKVGGQLGLFG